MTHLRMPRVRRLAAAVLTAIALTVASPASAAFDAADELHSLEHVRATGSVRSPDGVLERGCQTHPYRYRVRPGGSDWSLEVFLSNRRGKRLATGYEWKGKDPRRGRGRFEFCSQSTSPGRFTVRSRLTWDDGAYHEKWLQRRTIWLRR
ncbi:MAG TPA: hypothetical protein VFY58_06675 [Nocardioides sp.]|nr:hypothetical protein [Nocardioides sp.]